MSALLWNDPFYVNLTTGEVADDPTEGFVAVPKYGNYGGPFHPDEALLTKPNGDAYSYKQLVKFGDETQIPKDMSDYFYYEHDVLLATAVSPTERAEADIQLIRSLTLNDTSFSSDPEASLFDGVVTLGLIGQLAINDQLDMISPSLLLAAVTDAANDIEYGLQNLPQDPINEQLLALETIFGPGENGTYELEFTFPSLPGATEVQNELLEFSVVSAVAGAINEPLQGDMIAPPLFGVDDNYIIQVVGVGSPNLDVDILPA